MSRHDIPGLNPNHCVTIGWDPPLQTYFAIVLDPTKDDETDGYTVLWLGADRFGEIDRVHDLADKLKPLAEIDQDVLRQLIIDRNRDTA